MGDQMAHKLTKKQRSALRQIDQLAKERKRQQILGVGSIAVMAALIALYNLLTYQLGVIDEADTIIRGALYVAAMVIAGFCGIMLMRASRNQQKIDGYRQSNGISRDTLDAWRRGDIE